LVELSVAVSLIANAVPRSMSSQEILNKIHRARAALDKVEGS
jgi:hypothetical protein